MNASWKQKRENMHCLSAKWYLIAMLSAFMFLMHSEKASSNQNYDQMTSSGYLNKFLMEREANLHSRHFSPSNGNSTWYTFSKNFNKAFLLSRLGSAQLNLLLKQSRSNWRMVLSLCLNFDFSSEVKFLAAYASRTKESNENRSTPIYYDAVNRTYR
jgi:hypothetical protein